MYQMNFCKKRNAFVFLRIFFVLSFLFLYVNSVFASWNDCAISWNNFSNPGYIADYTYKGQIIRDHESTGTGDPTHGQANVPPAQTDLASGVTGANPGPYATPSFGYYDGGTIYDPNNLTTMLDDHIFFRMRVTGDPSSKGAFDNYHWNVLLDLDADGYKEYWVDLEGKYSQQQGTPDRLNILYSNDTKQDIPDPDASGVRVQYYSAFSSVDSACGGLGYSHTRVRPTGDGTGDYWIEIQVPMTAFKDSNGNQVLYPDSPVAFVFSTGASANDPLQKDWMMDLNFISLADPITFGDIIRPDGQPIIEFTDSLMNFVSFYTIGSNIYIYVKDPASNTNNDSIQSIQVTVTDPITGDDETVTLVETGASTGIFTNTEGTGTQLTTSLSDGIPNNTDNNYDLEVSSGNTIYVSFTNRNSKTVTDEASIISQCESFMEFTRANGLLTTNYLLTDNLSTSDKLYVTLSHAEANTNPATQQTISVSLTGVTGDQQTLTLTETGNNTGIFRNTTGLDTEIATTPIVQGDNLWEDIDGGVVTATYSYTCGGNPYTKTTTASLFTTTGAGRVYFTTQAGTQDVELYGPNQQVYIKVTDTVNCGTGSPKTLTVTVTSSTGDSYNVTVTETFPGSGVFKNTYDSLVTATYDGSYTVYDNVLEAADGDTLTVTYNDCDDGDSDPGNNNKTDAATYNAPSVVINEVLFFPEMIADQSCQTEYIQLYNSTNSDVNVTGYQITDGDNFTYTIPQFNGSPLNLRPGEKIYISIYDIVPADRYDSDNGAYYLFAQAIRHYCSVSTNTSCTVDSNCPGGEICIAYPSDEFGDPQNSDPADQISLYNSSGQIIDYISWSSTVMPSVDFLGDDSDAVARGIWQDDAFVNVSGMTQGWAIKRATSGYDSNIPNDWTYNQTANICSSIITRAVISSFNAFNVNGKVLIKWMTASETGTVGFYLYRKDDISGEYIQANKKLLPGILTAPQGGTYSYIDDSAIPGRTYTYTLVEVEAKGKNNTYGPFTVRPQEHWTTTGDPELMQIGYSRKAHEIPEAKKSRIESRKLSLKTVNTMEQPTSEKLSGEEQNLSAAKTKITLDTNGLYFIDAKDFSFLLNNGMQKKGATSDNSSRIIYSNQLLLTNHGLEIAYHIAQNNSGIYFYGQGIDSFYTDENVYWLEKGKGTQMEIITGTGPSPAPGGQTFTKTIHLEEDNWTAMSLFYDPDTDYWFWDYIVADDPVDGSKTFNLQAYGSSDTEDAALTVYLQGITNTDHHVVVHINGEKIGDSFWYGHSTLSLTIPFSQSNLFEGNNEVTVTGLLDTGAPYSIFYIDSFELSYQRLYKATNNKLIARGDGNPVVSIEGFSNPDILVFDISNPDKPKVIKAATVDQSSVSNYRVSFIPDSPYSLYFAVTDNGRETPSSVNVHNKSTLKRQDNRADYLVITPKELKDVSRSLADYRKRKGMKTMVVLLEDIMNEFNHGIYSPYAIKEFLSYAYCNWKVAPKYVVLAGKGTEDYKNNLGYGTNLIPPIMIGSPDGIFPSDNHFADVNGDHIPEMSIGRIPAITAAEMQSFVNKVITYENSRTTGWQKHVIMSADYPEVQGNFPADSNEVAALFPQGYTSDKIYLSELSIENARGRIIDGINRGAVLFNYIGHAGIDQLSQDGLLTTSDVTLLNNKEKLPVMTAMTCLMGESSIPGYDTLGEELVLKQEGGTIAVFSPTGMSINKEAVILDKEFFRSYFLNQRKVLGAIILETLKNGKINGVSGYMLDIYNIIGDPALRLK